ncbi:hypothetical protein [Arthrobacter oryzae]|uniref:hypothetical protein n=1 Tax=Arthrobacter oryzae TaxID=409290 RepID=UPI0028595647|nr:hypothetical protein [Arthrobacter oryzae]MDR6505005.1 hypothetical protein [Arthrobacter oryzae]
MSIPPVPPSYSTDPQSGGQYGQQPPQYGHSPQFGQPQPGQVPQFGQPQQYGQVPQYGQPQFIYPSEMPQQRTTDSSAPPQLVNISFWLLIGACLVWMSSVFLSIGSIDDPAMRSQFDARLATRGANMDFEAIKGIAVGMVVVIAAIGVLMYALVAFNIRKGRNWARILGTVLAAFSLLGVLEMGLGTLSILAGVAAMVLLYLPTAAPYFRKYLPFGNPYSQPGYPYGR